MSKYKVIYDNGFEQTLALMDQDFYDNVVVPTIQASYNDPTNKDKFDLANKWLKIRGFFFTSKSPLGLAMETGVLETKFCSMYVEFIKL